MTVDPQHLSVIVTTSPIHSHPSTQVMDDSIASILKQPSLAHMHIYIVCDGAKVTQENAYKSGIVTAETMERYHEYKARLHAKYSDKDRFTIIEREHRHGFAENIRYCMQEYAKTELVMIYQHDHVIEYVLDFHAVVQTMRKFRDQINYVTFMHKSYRNLIAKLANFGKMKQFMTGLLKKEQGYNLCLNPKEFCQDYVQYFRARFGLPLVPLNFWYDKVHIASRKYYLEVIFNPNGNYDHHRGKNMKTISFVEDTFGHCMKSTIIQEPSKILEYGAYILWDDKPVFYHQSGRSFITEQEREQVYLKNKSVNKSKSEDSESSEQSSDLAGDIEAMLTVQDSKVQ